MMKPTISLPLIVVTFSSFCRAILPMRTRVNIWSSGRAIEKLFLFTVARFGGRGTGAVETFSAVIIDSSYTQVSILNEPHIRRMDHTTRRESSQINKINLFILLECPDPGR